MATNLTKEQVLAIAESEIIQPQLALTRKFLDVHKVEILNGDPVVQRIRFDEVTAHSWPTFQ